MTRHRTTARMMLSAASLFGCHGPVVDVLVGQDAGKAEPLIYSDCDDVLTSAVGGDACRLPSACVFEEGCAVTSAHCVGGKLIFTRENICDECMSDFDCGSGALCLDEQCVVCPDSSECPACPDGQTYLSRNGCETCSCAPPSECSAPEDCGDEALTCALGQLCVEDCERHDCCANVCASEGCDTPAPLGCVVPCDRGECGGECLAESCFCEPDTGTWQCDGGCNTMDAQCSWLPD